MAKRTEVRLVDDLDGSDGSETVRFGIDGTGYEIDLGEVNAAKLRDVLAPFVAAGRRLGGGSARRPSAAAPAAPGPKRADAGEAREWLVANGYEVKDRGRLPAELVAAYESRTPAAPAAEPAPVGAPPKKTERVATVKFQAAAS